MFAMRCTISSPAFRSTEKRRRRWDWSTRRYRRRSFAPALAKLLLGKNPNTLRACKQAVRAVQGMPYELSADYLAAKSAQLEFYDDEKGRNEGLTQFLDEKSYRPGLGAMRRKKQSG